MNPTCMGVDSATRYAQLRQVHDNKLAEQRRWAMEAVRLERQLSGLQQQLAAAQKLAEKFEAERALANSDVVRHLVTHPSLAAEG